MTLNAQLGTNLYDARNILRDFNINMPAILLVERLSVHHGHENVGRRAGVHHRRNRIGAVLGARRTNRRR